jgi:hypothetical protein
VKDMRSESDLEYDLIAALVATVSVAWLPRPVPR